MHEFQHVITGHSAVSSIKQALGIEDGDIVKQADDLSIGPLGDVDEPHAPLRLAFLRELWGAEPLDLDPDYERFEDLLAAATQQFHQLPLDPRPCLVWFGSNANEQLTRRRTARF